MDGIIRFIGVSLFLTSIHHTSTHKYINTLQLVHTLFLPTLLYIHVLLSLLFAAGAAEIKHNDHSNDRINNVRDWMDDIRSKIDSNTKQDKEMKTIVMDDEQEIGYVQSLIVNYPPLLEVTSNYQDIKVYQSKHYGKVLVLDDCLQLTERDASHYNEMLAHVPILEYIGIHQDNNDNDDDDKYRNPSVRVLVVGGGDGYVVSELLKHHRSIIEFIDHVELDVEVIRTSEDIFPWASRLWDDEQVRLHVQDGAEFVQEQLANDNSYHVIIQDPSDPFYFDGDGEIVVLPSHVLYTKEHFAAMHKLLVESSGVLVFQSETYNIPSNLKEIRKWISDLSNIGFQNVRYGSISIGSYPTGQIGFMVCHALDACSEREDSKIADYSYSEMSSSLRSSEWSKLFEYYTSLSSKTLYYHPRGHRRLVLIHVWTAIIINVTCSQQLFFEVRLIFLCGSKKPYIYRKIEESNKTIF